MNEKLIEFAKLLISAKYVDKFDNEFEVEDVNLTENGIVQVYHKMDSCWMYLNNDMKFQQEFNKEELFKLN